MKRLVIEMAGGGKWRRLGMPCHRPPVEEKKEPPPLSGTGSGNGAHSVT